MFKLLKKFMKPMTRPNLCSITLRSWMQNIASCILQQYTREKPHSNLKNVWKEKPEHWPLNKPFYDTKNKSQDEHGKSISDEDLLKCLLDCCKLKNVQINFLYQKEISAWQEKQFILLYKLHIFRINMEKIEMETQTMLPYIESEEMKTALKNTYVNLTIEKDILRIRCKRQSEVITEFTRNLATILCKIIKGKDPEAKCDGIWTTPPENWPSAVPFYSPHNRGKCKQTGSDKELVMTLIQNPKAIIPQKYQALVTAFLNVVDSKNSREAKNHKETACRLFTIQNCISHIDNALNTMYEHGLFSTNMHGVLTQWWTKQTFDSQSEHFSKSSKIILDKRPAIQLQITKTSFKIGFKANYSDLSLVFYNITSETQNYSSQTTCSTSSKDFNKLTQKTVNQAVPNAFQNLKQTRGKKRQHPQDEGLLSGIKRPTLSADKNNNTKTDEIIKTQQSEQPLVRNLENDNEESQDREKWLNIFGITDTDLNDLLTSISTFSKEDNLNVLSKDYDFVSDHQLEILSKDIVGYYKSSKNSNLEELFQ